MKHIETETLWKDHGHEPYKERPFHIEIALKVVVIVSFLVKSRIASKASTTVPWSEVDGLQVCFSLFFGTLRIESTCSPCLCDSACRRDSRSSTGVCAVDLPTSCLVFGFQA